MLDTDSKPHVLSLCIFKVHWGEPFFCYFFGNMTGWRRMLLILKYFLTWKQEKGKQEEQKNEQLVTCSKNTAFSSMLFFAGER